MRRGEPGTLAVGGSSRASHTGERVSGTTGPSVATRVRFRDLSVTDPVLKAELLAAVDRVLSHGQLILGREVEDFERLIAERCGTRYCVGMGSGTDALYLALRSFGIGPGDQVITTPLSWIATLNAIHLCGAEPIFVDIRDDLNLDVDRIAGALTPRTKAIVPVHFTGGLCDMRTLCAVARERHLVVIEDAAQAFGARRDGTPAGAFGDAGVFSFNPMKVLPAYGEAGAVVTNDRAAHEKLLALRYAGTVDREICYDPSLNAKLDALQAAMLMVSVRYFESTIRRRLEIGRQYSAGLRDVVRCPALPSDSECWHVCFDYTIQADRRDALQAFLAGHGIETKIKHPILMPHQPAYAHLPRVALPMAERLVKEILCLPIHEKLTGQDVDRVIETVRAFFDPSTRAPAMAGGSRSGFRPKGVEVKGAPGLPGGLHGRGAGG